jgi:hypothetical protein
MLEPQFGYERVVDLSVKVCWDLDDVLPASAQIRFDRPHLPDALAGTQQIECLDDAQKLVLNHVRGNSYMNLFGFVEEYIIAQTVQHAQAEMFGDHEAIRALLRFGEEELKHQKLFKRYCAAFRRDFGLDCKLLGSAAEVANVVLDNSATAVMLVTLHLELMTQQHYIDCVRDDSSLDPLFSDILRHHWMEESQHAKIDVLELQKLTTDATQSEVDAAVDQYFGVLQAFDGLLAQQVDMDLETLAEKDGRHFTAPEAAEIRQKQLRSYRKDFLVMGMTNPMFVQTVRQLSESGATRLHDSAAALVN